MASKRSQVSQLDPIRSVTPVARGVDTFVLTKPRPVDDSALQVLDALSQLSPTLAKLGQEGRRITEEKEKTEITTQFTKDPLGFLEKVKANKFAGMTTPAQMLAGEYTGKFLARAYGSDLNQEYVTSPDILNSQDENAMLTFETQFRQKFIEANKELFNSPGVTEGFASTFRQYTASLDSQHISKARENRKASQLSGFNNTIFTNLDALADNRLIKPDFLKRIRSNQNDFMAAFGYNKADANAATIKAIVDYATSGVQNFEISRKILDAAQEIQTSPGSFLGDTVAGSMAIAKARTAIADAEHKADVKAHQVWSQTSSRVTSNVQGIILNKLKEIRPNDAVFEDYEIEDVFTEAQITEMKTYFPTFRRYFEDQKNFFMKEGTEVTGEDEIQMSLELAKIQTEDAKKLQISRWQQQGRLNNNREVYGKLWAQAEKTKEIKADADPDWSKDKLFKKYYQLLSGTNLDSGFSPFPPSDPRNFILTGFFEDFVLEIFYKDDYQSGNEAQRLRLIQKYYDAAQAEMIKLAKEPEKKSSEEISSVEQQTE